MSEPATRTQTEPLPKADCYSAGERAWMEFGQQLRGRVCAPWLKMLTRLWITPDHLTVVSLLFGLAFAPLWFMQWQWLAVLSLCMHVLLDGIDGPLARFQNAASPRGSFTDSFCDQVVVSTVTTVLMVDPPWVPIVAGAIFLVAYVGVLAISIARNSLQIPYSWLVRPRFFLFAAIPLQLLGVSAAVLVVVWISNVLLSVKLVTGFFNLRNELKGPAK